MMQKSSDKLHNSQRKSNFQLRRKQKEQLGRQDSEKVLLKIKMCSRTKEQLSSNASKKEAINFRVVHSSDKSIETLIF